MSDSTQDMLEFNERMIKDKENEIYELRSQLNQANHLKTQSQQMQETLVFDFKKTISVC